MQLHRHNRQQQFLPLPTGILFTVFSIARFVCHMEAHYKGRYIYIYRSDINSVFLSQKMEKKFLT
jgi:hypothetical protein